MDITRRKWFHMLSGAACLSRLGAVNAMAQSGAGDYKALVCIFLAGGNDGHSTVIPQATAEYNAYKSIRGGMALPDGNAKVLTVTTPAGVPYGLNNGLAAVHPLWAQGKLAVVANVGMLVRPVTRAEYAAQSVPVPTNLFSHSDQMVQAQSGFASPTGGTGWAGRLADAMEPLNAASSFPSSISMAGPALFGSGSLVQSAALIPGFDMELYGMNPWPQTAADARKAALQEILALDSGMALVQAANKVRRDALDLSAMLKSVNTSSPVSTPFPGTGIGRQLLDVAKIIKLRTSTGLRRQVFFCSLGGFDTHGSQSWMHWDLLRQLSEAMYAFYNATVELGVAGQVTAFTQSEFGRTLQPSGTGSDHGWGNHQLVMGGAVKGGNLYGRYPVMALGGPDDAGTRGAMIPSTAQDQYAATMASWFGLSATQLTAVFPNLSKFPVTNLGFV